MPIRASRLAKNQSAGCLDETPLRTVHQSPPKNTTPTPPPAAHASTNIRVSFIVILLFVPHCLFFLGDPMPRVQTADHEPAHQQRQSPGMLARMVFVQPDTERCAEQRRHRHRPANKPHHAQAEPDPLRGFARLELADCFRAYLVSEG